MTETTAPRWSLARGLPVTSSAATAKASRKLAVLLDDAFRVSGTNLRFGWDTIIGLVPGVGDAATTILALVPVATAWKVGASRWMIARMLANVGIDAVIGVIPVIGDFFDIFFRANRRNNRILKHHLAKHGKPDRNPRRAEA